MLDLVCKYFFTKSLEEQMKLEDYIASIEN